MPSRIIRDLQVGEGVAHSVTNAPRAAPDLPLPTSLTEDLEEPGGAWTVEAGLPALLEDFEMGVHHHLGLCSVTNAGFDSMRARRVSQKAVGMPPVLAMILRVQRGETAHSSWVSTCQGVIECDHLDLRHLP
jgi:hypothetical protein